VEVAIRQADSPKVFGGILVPQRDALVARFGVDAYGRALARVPAEMRAEYEGITAEGWCRSATVECVVVELSREAGADPREVTDATVHYAVRSTVGTLWRVLMKMTGDLTLLRRAPMFYARSFDRGSLTGERISPGHAELVLDGWPDVTDLQAIGIAAGVRAVMEMAGRPDVVVLWRRDAELTRFDVTWRP